MNERLVVVVALDVDLEVRSGRDGSNVVGEGGGASAVLALEANLKRDGSVGAQGDDGVVLGVGERPGLAGDGADGAGASSLGLSDPTPSVEDLALKATLEADGAVDLVVLGVVHVEREAGDLAERVLRVLTLTLVAEVDVGLSREGASAIATGERVSEGSRKAGRNGRGSLGQGHNDNSRENSESEELHCDCCMDR